MNEQIKSSEQATSKKDSVGGRLITNAIFLVLYLLIWIAIPVFMLKDGEKAGLMIGIVGNAILVLLTWLIPYFRRSTWLRWWAWLGILDIAWYVYLLIQG